MIGWCYCFWFGVVEGIVVGVDDRLVLIFFWWVWWKVATACTYVTHQRHTSMLTKTRQASTLQAPTHPPTHRYTSLVRSASAAWSSSKSA